MLVLINYVCEKLCEWRFKLLGYLTSHAPINAPPLRLLKRKSNRTPFLLLLCFILELHFKVRFWGQYNLRNLDSNKKSKGRNYVSAHFSSETLAMSDDEHLQTIGAQSVHNAHQRNRGHYTKQIYLQKWIWIKAHRREYPEPGSDAQRHQSRRKQLLDYEKCRLIS